MSNLNHQSRRTGQFWSKFLANYPSLSAPECKVDFFDGQNTSGEKNTYYGNAKSLRRNDKMRSMTVSPACCVTLFADRNYQGRSTKECAENGRSLTYNKLNADWDKKVSSIKLELSKYLSRIALSNNLELNLLTLSRNVHLLLYERKRTFVVDLSTSKKKWSQD